MKPWRKHIVGALVLLHLASVGLSSLPSVRGNLAPALMREPVVQHELRQWSEAFAKIGLDIPPSELEERVVALGHVYSDVRDALVEPFAPYRKYFGTGQTWNLFTSAHRIPGRLEIDIEERGNWRQLYVARSDEHAWRKAAFDDARLRKAVYFMNWRRSSRSYQSFGEWVAREVAAEFPEATRVRLRFWRYETPSPEAVRRKEEPKGRYVQTRIYTLAEHRAGGGAS
jgi:hypothetical protein